MKKLVLFFAAAAFAVSFAACGNKAADNNNDEAEPVAEPIEVVENEAPAGDEIVEVEVEAEVEAPAAE